MRLPPGPLRSRNFRLLLACNVISVTGNAVAIVATPFAVLAIGGSAIDVGYVATAFTAALLVFLLLGGVVADRLPRHKVILTANAVQALAQGASAALVLAGSAHVWQLMLLSVVRGAGQGFYFPAAAGLLPQTVPAGDRAQASAMQRIGFNTAQIGGSALGGVLVGLAGPGWGLAVDAASFAVAAALRSWMRFPARPPAATAGFIHEMREGWRDFISRRWLWAIVLEFSCVVAISVATTGVLGPLVARDRLGGAGSWGVVLACYAVGALIGGIVMLRYRPQRMLLAASLAVPSFSVFLFALAVPLAVPALAAAALFAGGCVEVFSVNWATTMMQEIPPEMLSRLSAYDMFGSFALAPIGTAVAGPAAAAFGTPAVLAAGGVLIVLLTVAVLCVPEVRQLRREAAARPADPGLATG
jgi:MFS family permease